MKAETSLERLYPGTCGRSAARRSNNWRDSEQCQTASSISAMFLSLILSLLSLMAVFNQWCPMLKTLGNWWSVRNSEQLKKDELDYRTETFSTMVITAIATDKEVLEKVWTRRSRRQFDFTQRHNLNVSIVEGISRFYSTVNHQKNPFVITHGTSAVATIAFFYFGEPFWYHLYWMEFISKWMTK